VDPTRDDPLLRDATEGLGGPLGRHARTGAGWWTPLRVSLAALGVALVVGYLQKLPCRDPARWTDQYQLTHACYTDVVASWAAYGLDSGAIPYFGFPVPYPPLIGALMYVAAAVTGLLPGEPSAGAYFDVTVVLLAALAVVVVITTALLAGKRRPWDALMVALAPVLILHAFTNWDLLPLALLGIAMVAWSRDQPAWAGLMLGLATAAKLWPLLLLLALAMLCWRAGRWREWVTTAVVTVAAWAAVSVPLLLVVPDGARRFWQANISRGPDWDSLWLVVQDATGITGWALPSALSIAGAIVVAVVVAILVRRAPRRPRVAQVMFVLLALFLVLGKVFSPQAALWLTPLAVLARPRWRMFLVWQAAEVLLTVNRMLLLVGLDVADRGLPRGWWYVTVAVRDIALLALVAFVVREMGRPELDVVRTEGVDDPAGGPLDGAPDVPARELELGQELEASTVGGAAPDGVDPP